MEAEKIPVLEAAIEEFNISGLKFTMDDIAKRLSMSKKTIYTIFPNKKSLFMDMVDYCFDAIKESEKKILEDENLSLKEKIKKIIVVLPDRYKQINLSRLFELKQSYPKIYQKIAVRLESDWDNTISLIEEGIQKNEIRPISIPVLKTMVEGTIEQFFCRDILVENKIRYEDALEEMISIIMIGIGKE